MCLKAKTMSIKSTATRSPSTISNSPSEKTLMAVATSDPKQKRKRVLPGRVRFSHAQIVGTVPERSSISMEDHRNIWYPSHEMDGFKAEIRSICEKIAENELCSVNTGAAFDTHDSFGFTVRGLEQRICKNRQRNKYLAIWGTLKAQKRNKDPEFIAMIARKCTYAATNLAIMEGARDYCEIYNPESIPSLSQKIESFASKSFPMKLIKRKSPASASVTTNSNSRNVRIRIS